MYSPMMLHIPRHQNALLVWSTILLSPICLDTCSSRLSSLPVTLCQKVKQPICEKPSLLCFESFRVDLLVVGIVGDVGDLIGMANDIFLVYIWTLCKFYNFFIVGNLRLFCDPILGGAIPHGRGTILTSLVPGAAPFGICHLLQPLPSP